MMNRARFRRMLVADKLITNYFKNPAVTRLKKLTGHDYRHFQPRTVELNNAYVALVEGELEGRFIKPLGYSQWCVKTWYGYVPLFDY